MPSAPVARLLEIEVCGCSHLRGAHANPYGPDLSPGHGECLEPDCGCERFSWSHRLRYCRPWEAGLDSETAAVCRRLGRLLTALDVEITPNVVEGAIVDDVRRFRLELVTRLEADGYTLSYDGGSRVKVRPPGHKRPFRRQVAP